LKSQVKRRAKLIATSRPTRSLRITPLSAATLREQVPFVTPRIAAIERRKRAGEKLPTAEEIRAEHRRLREKYANDE